MSRTSNDINARLMDEQRHITPRDRKYFSAKTERFFRWVQSLDGWGMADAHTGNVFSPRWDTVVFSENGYKAFRNSPQRREADEVANRLQNGHKLAAPMTPLKIALLCSYLTLALDTAIQPPRCLMQEALEELCRDGYATRDGQDGYQLTAKARVFVEHLLAQPQPVQDEPKWRMPV